MHQSDGIMSDYQVSDGAHALRSASLRSPLRGPRYARPLAGSLAATQRAAAAPPCVASQLAPPEVLHGCGPGPRPHSGGPPARLLPVASLPSPSGSARLPGGAASLASPARLFAPLRCCRAAALRSPRRARRARRLGARLAPAGAPSLGRLCAAARLRGRSLPPSALGPGRAPLRAPCSVALAALGLVPGAARRPAPSSRLRPFGLRGRGRLLPRPLPGLRPGFSPLCGRGLCSRAPAPAALTGARVSLRCSIIAARSRLPFGFRP